MSLSRFFSNPRLRSAARRSSFEATRRPARTALAVHRRPGAVITRAIQREARSSAVTVTVPRSALHPEVLAARWRWRAREGALVRRRSRSTMTTPSADLQLIRTLRSLGVEPRWEAIHRLELAAS